MAFLLAFMALTGLLGWYNIRGLEAAVTVPDEVYCGVETLVTVRVTNTKRRLTSFLLCAEFLHAKADLMLVDRRTSAARTVACTFPRRGAYASFGVRISSPFPVNFFVRRLQCGCDAGITVFAAPIACRIVAADSGRDRAGALLRRASGHDGEMSRISDYTGREPLKNVHWRLSARHGDLKVKGFDATGTDPVVIDIDSLPARTRDDAVGCATFLVNDLMRRNRPVGLRLGSLVLKPALSRSHRLMLLQELATHAAD